MSVVVVRTRDASAAPDMPGATWTYMQYVLGLERLGFESYWVDALGGSIDPSKGPHSLEYLIGAFGRTAERFGFDGRWCVTNGERCFGLARARLEDLADEAELLVTISGQLDPDSPLMRIPRRAYVDVDPGFTQIWADQGALSLDGHTHYFSVGLNVGGPQFRAPNAGVEWHPIVPPVVLAEWPALIEESCRRWTTIADWTGSQTVALAGEVYGGKRDEFMRVLTLPAESHVRLEPAILFGPGDHADLGALHEHGWRVRDPVWYAGDPDAYREFIQYSRAEFSVAKDGYVRTNSGWVSDRTAAYLASGKPALVQATGFEEHLPVGKGLLAFRTLEEAVEGIRRIESDYVAHCHAARALAEDHCDSAKVLGALLEACGMGVTEPAA
jgi:hypothetical protein